MKSVIQGSIRKRLAALLIVLSIGPLMLFGGILLWQNLIIQQQEAKEHQHELTTKVSYKLSSSIHEQEVILLSALRTSNFMEMESKSQRLLLSKLLFPGSDLPHRDILYSVELFDSKGQKLLSLAHDSFSSDSKSTVRSGTEALTPPAENGEITYGLPSFNESTGEPFITMGIPILDYRDLAIRGVLVARINLRFMRDLLGEINIGRTGIAYIVDSTGRVIAHPNTSLVLKGTYFKVPEQASVIKGLQGTLSLVDSDTIQLGRQRIKVVTELPVFEALRYTIRSLVMVSVFLLLTLLGAVALGVVLARQIIRPIESLSGIARAVGKGDFSRRMHHSRKDEIGELADEFNSMTSKLTETISSLEQQIVETKKAEDQITKQNELLNNVINSLTHPFYVIDANDYSIVMANSAAGFGELSQKPTCHSLTHHSDEPCEGDAHPCTIKEIKRIGKPVTLEHIHSDSQGNACFFEVHGFPLFNKDGDIVQIIEYSIDVTEKKKLENQFRHAQKMEAIGQLSGGVAHDFNNMLSIILGYGQLALRDIPADHPAVEKIGNVLDAGNKAAVLTRQLLAFSRRQILETRVVNLNSLVENMTKLLRRIIGENIALEMNTNRPTQNIKVDPGQIEQVLMNLIVNAKYAMQNGGRLTIETGNITLDEEYARSHEGVQPGPYVVLAVTDTGCGMSREVQERIFEPFFTTKGMKGTGLGLSTVYGIVKQHGGHIYVYSEPEVGTTFKIYLPSTEESGEEGVSNEPERIQQGDRTILVVDDEPSIRRLVMDTLQPLGYRTLEASCGEEALQINEALAGELDLLLTDVIMPGMNGRELADAICKSRPSTKVLFMSGYTDNTIAHYGILDAEINFLQKPVTTTNLIKKINSIFKIKS